MSTLKQRFQAVRKHTENLMAPLNVEDHLAQPTEEVSPPKWHLGHTTWFFETLILKKFKPGYLLFDERFPFYFNSYYQSLGERLVRHRRGNLIRPTLSEVHDYRQYVDEAILSLPDSLFKGELADLFELGLHHEQQHQELFLTDYKYILASQPFAPHYQADFSEGQNWPRAQNWLPIEGGLQEIGHAGKGFHYDNEGPRHKVFLEDFAIADRPVSNAEWLAFIEAGGYQNAALWHSDGWDWIQSEQIKAPLYWAQEEGDWHRFTLAGLQAIEPNQAVCHISYYEAYAFCQWNGHRLPTEAEWELAQNQFDWGERWEWTESAYLPYPGFRPLPGAAGEYNGKFMVNQMVLRGSSVATAKGHARPTYRNFFHPPMRWQFTGLRLAKARS